MRPLARNHGSTLLSAVYCLAALFVLGADARSGFVPSDTNGWGVRAPSFAPVDAPTSSPTDNRKHSKSTKKHRKSTNQAVVPTKSRQAANAKGSPAKMDSEVPDNKAKKMKRKKRDEKQAKNGAAFIALGSRKSTHTKKAKKKSKTRPTVSFAAVKDDQEKPKAAPQSEDAGFEKSTKKKKKVKEKSSSKLEIDDARDSRPATQREISPSSSSTKTTTKKMKRKGQSRKKTANALAGGDDDSSQSVVQASSLSEPQVAVTSSVKKEKKRKTKPATTTSSKALKKKSVKKKRTTKHKEAEGADEKEALESASIERSATVTTDKEEDDGTAHYTTASEVEVVAAAEDDGVKVRVVEGAEVETTTHEVASESTPIDAVEGDDESADETEDDSMLVEKEADIGGTLLEEPEVSISKESVVAYDNGRELDDQNVMVGTTEEEFEIDGIAVAGESGHPSEIAPGQQEENDGVDAPVSDAKEENNLNLLESEQEKTAEGSVTVEFSASDNYSTVAVKEDFAADGLNEEEKTLAGAAQPIMTPGMIEEVDEPSLNQNDISERISQMQIKDEKVEPTAEVTKEVGEPTLNENDISDLNSQISVEEEEVEPKVEVDAGVDPISNDVGESTSEVSETDDGLMDEYEPDLLEPHVQESAIEIGRLPHPPTLETPDAPGTTIEIAENEEGAQPNVEAHPDSEGMSEDDPYLEKDTLLFIGKVLQEDVSSWVNGSDVESPDFGNKSTQIGGNDASTYEGSRGGHQADSGDTANDDSRVSSVDEAQDIQNDTVDDEGEESKNIESAKIDEEDKEVDDNEEDDGEDDEDNHDEEGIAGSTLGNESQSDIPAILENDVEDKEAAGTDGAAPDVDEETSLPSNEDIGGEATKPSTEEETEVAPTETEPSSPVEENVDKDTSLSSTEAEQASTKRIMKFDRSTLETCEDQDSDATVSIVTWNLAEESPSEDDAAFIRKFRKAGVVPGTGSDLVLISAQECENIKPRRTEGRRSREYRRLMIAMLGKGYVPIALHLLGGIQFGLFAKKSLLKEIEHVSVVDVTCGIGNVFHNKGAIAAFVTLKARTPSGEAPGAISRSKSLKMMFVTAHMAAHVKNSDARDADFWRISSELEAQSPDGFLPKRALDASTYDGSFLFDSVDRVFFCGDLNYRVDLPRELAEFTVLHPGDSIKEEDDTRMDLLRHDQLARTIADRRAFPGFAEGKIVFAPTFKFDKESDEYDTSHKHRIPAWTDRILFKPLGTRVLEYTSVPEAQHSDHRPVYGTFRVNMQGRELPPKKQKRKRKPTKKGSAYDA